VDVSLLIRQRLDELGLEQKDLARAARVTESYISQLLARKRAPPAPNRTDVYPKMERFLKLPGGELARLAALERTERLQRELGAEPAPLLRDVREVILRKCDPATAGHVRRIFERQPFGELERLVTQRLVDVVKRVVQEQLDHEHWLRVVAQLAGRGIEEMRVTALEFLDTDFVQLSAEDCATFLDPLIESWSIDLATFALDVVLDHRATAEPIRRFEFVEREPGRPGGQESGLKEFLEDPSLSGTITAAELECLERLRFRDRRPTALYYYRELQNLRDPLHFRPLSAPAPG
jgi:transcriptional regulator with XRE-family HTH domain